MRILIFGANGMLGHKLYQRLGENFEVVGTIRTAFHTIEKFEIFDRNSILEAVTVEDFTSIRRAIEFARPDCVINAIGVTKQAPELANPVSTLAINSVFPQRLQKLSHELGFRLIMISTDCVYSGQTGYYSEDDIPDATDIYGISKLLGEVSSGNSLTLRTSIIGRELGTHQSIVEWFLGNRGARINGYTKAIFSGFPTTTFANILADLIDRYPAMTGVWNVASEAISKHDLLLHLKEHFDVEVEIVPDDSVALNRSLDASRFQKETGFAAAPWNEMIMQMAVDPTPYDQWQG
ncbi:MAG: SDR family oxidoreductase [Pyrinomonadaceae bacterium]